MSTRSSTRLRNAAQIKSEQQQQQPPLTDHLQPSRKRPRSTTSQSPLPPPSYYDSSATNVDRDLELDEQALGRLRLEADGLRRALADHPPGLKMEEKEAEEAEEAAQQDQDTPRKSRRVSRRSAVKQEEQDQQLVTTPPTPLARPTNSKTKPRTTTTTTTTADPGNGPINKQQNQKQPKHWQSVLDDIREFRRHHTAPVDTMGCERLAEVGETIPPAVSRFQTLMSLVLSSQTKDTVTSVAIRRLQRELKGGLTIQSVLDANHNDLNRIISAVGFHNKKTVFMKQIAEICREQYAGDIPDSPEALMALPGVGPKMAYLTLQVAWQKNMGIGVDTHVHRIANRLGWVKTEKDGPEGTRKALQSWLPKEHWREINYLLVGFGQVLCLPRGPLCDICPVRDRCPTAPRSAKMKPIVKQEDSTEMIAIKSEPIEEVVVAVKEEENLAVIEASSSSPSATSTPQPAEGQVLIHTRPSTSRRSNFRSASPSNTSIKQEDKDDDTVVVKQEIEDESTSKYF